MIPFIGEIRILGWNEAPPGWAVCDGSQLGVQAEPDLFQVIGTTYGGDGVNYFNLPDLRGCVPVHQAPGLPLGQFGGSETVKLNSSQLPSHGHELTAMNSIGGQTTPGGAYLTTSTGPKMYEPIPGNPSVRMAPGAILPTGNGQAHDNMMPFIVLNFVIALNGLSPYSG